MSLRVIIDTDPGIDDAIAILFALAHPEIEVLAVTTVAGNIGIETTTRNALRIQALAGTTVPVYPGAAAPLVRAGRNEVRVHGFDGLGGVAFPQAVSTAADEPAHEAIARILAGEPEGTIDVLALAPLTNIARLLEHAPENARRMRRLIAMGGAIHERGNVGARSEFNIAHDPEAARIVLSAGLPMALIPLDATRRVRADRAWLERLTAIGSPPALAVRDLTAAYFATTQGGESRPLHDPCVPVLALRPELFAVERMGLSVDCAMGETAGALSPGPAEIDVAMQVESAAVLDLLVAAFA